MNSRRKFLIRGSLATTAMLAAKPFNAIAGVASPLTNLFNQQNNLVFLHTASMVNDDQYKAIRYISATRENTVNTVLLNAGKDSQDNTALKFDAGADTTTEEYKIITKGGIKTGIITAKPGETGLAQKVNDLTAYLKKEKNCQVVVCLSQLGYKNRSGMDDITLAEKSTGLDIIIGGHTTNYSRRPVIALSSNRTEVIIHSAAASERSVGNIKVDFDEKGHKRNISFHDPFVPVKA